MKKTNENKTVFRANATLPMRILAQIFVTTIAALGIANFVSAATELEAAASATGAGFNAPTFEALEAAYDENLYARNGYIELYGGVQRAMLKDEVGDFDVVRDAAGFLHMSESDEGPVLENPVGYTAEELAGLGQFNAYCAERGIAFVCVKSINRVIPGFTCLPAGVISNAAGNAEKLCAAARENGVDVLDLNEEAQSAGLAPESLFYRTDHHWTVETALWAHGVVLRHLRDIYGVGAPDLEQVTDIANYEKTVYENRFLGSIGRRTGSLYSGWDDFTLLTPKFETNLTYVDESQTITRTGAFEETLLFQEWLANPDPYQRNCYGVYLGGDQAERTITNPAGTGRVLMIQNSFGGPLTAFMALSCEQITVLDLRHFTGMSVLEYLEANPDFDAVICLDQFDMPRFYPNTP